MFICPAKNTLHGAVCSSQLTSNIAVGVKSKDGMYMMKINSVKFLMCWRRKHVKNNTPHNAPSLAKEE